MSRPFNGRYTMFFMSLGTRNRRKRFRENGQQQLSRRRGKTGTSANEYHKSLRQTK